LAVASLLYLYQKKPTATTKKYGADNKYKIPVFRLLAMVLRPFETVLSTVILHIAHCADANVQVSSTKNVMINIFFILILLKLTVQ
jgi:hypothetical protein